jgi:hypothetical protein
MNEEIDWQMAAFLVLSAPGRFWVWLCGLICGIEVEGLEKE